MNNKQTTQLELASLSFEDIDHMVEFSKQAGWDNICTQLTPGKNRICYNNFSLPGLMIAHYRVEQSIHNVFALPEGTVVFLICRVKLPLIWCDRELPPTLLGIARTGLEHEVVLHPGWDCYEFTVSEDLIRQTGIFPADFFNKTRRLEDAYLPLMEPVTDRFLRELDSLFQPCKTTSHVRRPKVDQAQFRDFIVHRLLEVVDTGLDALDSHELKTVRRPDLVSDARDLVTANLKQVFTVASISQTLNVSERVLNYAFRDTLGISPLQYLQAEKLNAARRQLKNSALSVIEVCDMYGFNTPSRFSRQYQRMFGELPSHTRYPNGRQKD
jgi:AraC-like DNA-binding protein